MRSQTQLLIIDPQNDFCDLPTSWCPPDPLTGEPMCPALPVPGAHADMGRLAAFIRRAADQLDDITVTLDSHNRLHIAHPNFWQTGDGEPVVPFTQITARQARTGAFRTRDPAGQERAVAYLDALEGGGRHTLMVWPVHCEIGTWGHAVHADVRAAYNAWEVGRLKIVRKVTKGSNLWTEHYSALKAELPDRCDPLTLLNRALLAELDKADRLIIAGEAGSHCVKATTEDLADNLPGGGLERLVLLTDCMSTVAGFAAEQDAFLRSMTARGARLSTSVEMLRELNR